LEWEKKIVSFGKGKMCKRKTLVRGRIDMIGAGRPWLAA
jgi:hypothetical protein